MHIDILGAELAVYSGENNCFSWQVITEIQFISRLVLSQVQMHFELNWEGIVCLLFLTFVFFSSINLKDSLIRRHSNMLYMGFISWDFALGNGTICKTNVQSQNQIRFIQFWNLKIHILDSLSFIVFSALIHGLSFSTILLKLAQTWEILQFIVLNQSTKNLFQVIQRIMLGSSLDSSYWIDKEDDIFII